MSSGAKRKPSLLGERESRDHTNDEVNAGRADKDFHQSACAGVHRVTFRMEWIIYSRYSATQLCSFSSLGREIAHDQYKSEFPKMAVGRMRSKAISFCRLTQSAFCAGAAGTDAG
jgi:hypothetical protein